MERLGARLGRPAAERPRQPGAAYSFISAKGGSGSTTVVINLAIVLHQLTGKKTLLVDLELQLGEVALLLGIQPRFNFVDMVQNFHRMDAALLASFIERHSSGVHVLSAPVPSGAGRRPSPSSRSAASCSFLRQHYDYVLIDTSKSLPPVDAGGLRAVRRGVPGDRTPISPRFGTSSGGSRSSGGR